MPLIDPKPSPETIALNRPSTKAAQEILTPKKRTLNRNIPAATIGRATLVPRRRATVQTTEIAPIARATLVPRRRAMVRAISNAESDRATVGRRRRISAQSIRTPIKVRALADPVGAVREVGFAPPTERVESKHLRAFDSTATSLRRALARGARPTS